MQVSAAHPVREYEKPMSWPRAIVIAVGFFFVAALLLGQVPSYVFTVSTLSTLQRFEQGFLDLGLLALGMGLLCFELSFLYDPRPLLPWPLFALAGLAIAAAGGFLDAMVAFGGWNEFLPSRGYLFNENWFQANSIDLVSVGMIALFTGLGMFVFAVLVPFTLSGRLVGPMRDLLVRVSLGAAIAIAAVWGLIYTFWPTAVLPQGGLRGALGNVILFAALGLALFALQLWLLPVMTANRQQFMPAVYLHGVVGLIGMVAVPLLILWAIVYPVVALIRSVDTEQFWVQCAQRTVIPGSCTFTPFTGYIISAIVFTNLFAILVAGLYFWSTRRNTVVLGATIAIIFLALAVTVIHVDDPVQLPRGLVMAIGIAVLAFFFTWATQREFAPTSPQQLGCTGQWLVLGTLLLFFLLGFAFFSLPQFFELESGLAFFYQPGRTGLHDAFWITLLMGGFAAYQLVVLIRRRYHPMLNWRKFGLWVLAAAVTMEMIGAVQGFRNNVLEQGIDGIEGSHAWFLTGIIFSIVGIVACALGALRARAVPWFVTIVVSALVGAAVAAVTYTFDPPYPELVIFGFILTTVGALAYTAAGPDPELADMYEAEPAGNGNGSFAVTRS